METMIPAERIHSPQFSDAIRASMAFALAQDCMPSDPYVERYLNQHAFDIAHDGSDSSNVRFEVPCGTIIEESPSLTAIARLEWLLRNTRPSLGDKFSEKDIIHLLDCYQGQILTLDCFTNMASDLCDHWGIELGEHQKSEIAPLVHKLLNLNQLEAVTLADVLEQAWHRGMRQEGKSPRDFFSTLGIELS